ncbi:alkaline phosphatase family protein [Massilia sp. MB5]|uniref:nucleotide pyrophosphatase/phosphodiesterase family protein n=1 Tax=unclassified Massilia TaxID=2609279 RepID=UPI00067C726E|nr:MULTISPECIES: nucleotide pyrophosphatase/phosphodiesterase family protein [unclassified Massilia]AKU20833.1 phosphodiesterase [Massilia sp. NR 4-1]UMR29649.1 alkaline phosphatase family protein [Massilia sp. MB5]
MQPLLILNIVGLTPRLLGPYTPRLSAFAARGALRHMSSAAPGLTCTVQSNLLTGSTPQQHGIVGNGWYFRDTAEIGFWRQSNRLVAGEKIWDAGKQRDPRFSCANLCWWYNMAASHDVGLTPRPIYKADGQKLPDCYTKPAAWRDELQWELGPFPLFQFWGPATSIASSRWIAGAARLALRTYDPTLSLVYLPHLDYDLQRHGPDPSHPAVRRSLAEIDRVAGELIAHAEAAGRRVLLLSEYGITAADRPVHLNRHLRAAGLLAVRTEDGGELLDPIASDAFAVADHQIAHVYVADAARIDAVQRLLAAVPGVEAVLRGPQRARLGLDHARSGELVVLADARSWFSYYYWLDDRRAPDFARTVDIHRKPGYDPAELFFDRQLPYPKLTVLHRLLQRKLGLRALMDVIGLDATLVKGSHGRPPDDPDDGALIVADHPDALPAGIIAAEAVKALALDMIFAPAAQRPQAMPERQAEAVES